MKTKLLGVLSFVLSLVSVNSVSAQSSIKGKAIVTIFGSYQQGIGHNSDESGFNIARSYLGYGFELSDRWSGKVVMDIGSSKLEGNDLERIAYLKNAMVTWKTSKVTLDLGLVGRKQFSVQEKVWGYRYLWKSFQDQYKFGSSADAGVNLTYKPSSAWSFDLSIHNGEGYKKLSKDSHLRYGVGITNQIKSLQLRGYYDVYSADDAEGEYTHNMAFLAAIVRDNYRVGVEYNHRFNDDFKAGVDRWGYSAYGSVKLEKKWSLFARYDQLVQENEKGQEFTKMALSGIEYRPIKQIKISPNVRCSKETGAEKDLFVNLSLEVKL